MATLRMAAPQIIILRRWCASQMTVARPHVRNSQSGNEAAAAP